MKHVFPIPIHAIGLHIAGCDRLMGNGRYWRLMEIYFHPIYLSWGSTLILMADQWHENRSPLIPNTHH